MELGIDVRRLVRNDECLHETGIEVATGGLKRIVCENCGHVTIQPTAGLYGDIDRSRFSRRSEKQARPGSRPSVDATGAPKEALRV